MSSGLAIASIAAPSSPATAALAPDPSASLAGGLSHQCAIRADQTVACWGGNEFGQLGNNSTNTSKTPQLVTGLTDVVAIDSMFRTTCALRADGGVVCWGDNDDGQLGAGLAIPFSAIPVTPVGLTDVVAIDVGLTHACALSADGSVACWGANGSGQLGNNSTTSSNVPVSALFFSDARSISAGSQATCAVRRTNELSCWGRQTPGPIDSTLPLDIIGVNNARSVSVGTGATCIITLDDTAMCAGNGPLGDGSTDSNDEFVEVALGSVLDIDIGGASCAIAPDTSVYCWGQGQGLFASGGSIVGDSELPERVPGLDGIVAVDVNLAHTCALSGDGEILCLGTNLDGQLQFEATARLEPGFTFPGTTATDVSAGLSTCLVETGGTVTCAGLNTLTEVPLDFTSLDPARVPGLTDIEQVSVNFLHNCAKTTTGRAWCWGINIAGEVGVPPTSGFPDDPDVVQPTQVAGVVGVEDIAAGANFSCASTGSAAYCWGSDASGQLGNDAALINSSSPVEVQTSPSTTVVDLLDAGLSHACARFINAIVSIVGCWGQNDEGQLGDGSTMNRSTFVSTGVLWPKAVATGTEHSCAIDGGDKVWCWGQNGSGQLGIGTNLDHTTPQQLAPFPATPTAVVAGESHSCALLATGVVHCWGANSFRQIGQSSSDDFLTPIEVPGITTAVQISASFSTTCARLADMTVTCWGDNTFGQAGAVPTRENPTVIDPGGPMLISTLAAAPIITPIDPARLLETRDGQPTVDGDAAGGGPITGGTEVEVQVTGRAGVPADADFAVLNITAVRPAANGFLTAHSCATPRPVVASLNYANPSGVGAISLGNESIVELSPTGTMCIYSSSPTDLTVDITAYGTSLGGYNTIAPSRILDSRADETTIDGEFELGAPVDGGTEITLQIHGRAGVPATASAAVLYVAAVNPTGVGFVTAHPCEPDRPLSSSLNFGTLANGQRVNRGNEIIAPLDDEGNVCLFVSTTTDLTVDLVGSIDPATTYEVETPARLLESRPSQSTVDGLFELGAPLATGEEIELDVAGRGGVAADATAAVLNITAVNPSGVGFVTAHPCSATRPTASSLNFTATPASGAINGGNEVVAPLSVDGTVCLFVSRSTHLTVDVVGSN